MKKVAIVGVEGSGKTVMLAGLGELYSHPDADGYFFEPQSLATFEYVKSKIAMLRSGRWPDATPPDDMRNLGWIVRKSCRHWMPRKICALSCLDFAGEVYLSAFCGKENPALSESVWELKKYLYSADAIVLLINLRDVVTRDAGDRRAVSTEYASLQLLKAIFENQCVERKYQQVLIALSQADAYRSTIEACGGARQTLSKYLPSVGNSFGWLDVVTVSVVDKTTVADDGTIVPDKDFSLEGLEPMMKWILHPPFELRRINLFVLSLWLAVKRVDWRHLYLNLKFAACASLSIEILLYFWMRSVSDSAWWFFAWLVFLGGGCVGCGVGWLAQVADHFERLNGAEDHLWWERVAGVVIALPLITLVVHIIKWMFS